MSSASRVVSAVCAAPLLLFGTVAAASASPAGGSAAAFTLSPSYGRANQTVTLTAQSSTTFANTESVTFNGVAAAAVHWVSAQTITATVPASATSGPVDATDGTTTYDGPDFVLQQPLDTTMTVSKHEVTFSRSLLVTATASAPSLGSSQRVPGLKAQLLHRTSTATRWHQAGGIHKTNNNGTVKWSVTPGSNGRYEVRFRSDANYMANTTTAQRVIVRAKLHVDGISTAPALSASPITGTVAPGKPGHLLLQRQGSKGAWGTVAKTTPQHGKFTFTISPSSYQELRYRVVDPATKVHDQAISSTLHITVVHRSLTYGDAGKDVLALQHRLRALKYDVGPKSSYYGWDMVHAVTAFQKVQGDARDGVADTQVWKQVNHPKRLHLRYPYPGVTAVEINLTKQVLMIAKNGKIWRILDTSTAGGYTYTDSAGEQATAITPTGHFSIKYKVDHLVTDKLGSLYRPSYFDYSGDAIHGEGDTNEGGNVPPYPASHGCVRITDLAVDRYYNVLAVGTSVWIYH